MKYRVPYSLVTACACAGAMLAYDVTTIEHIVAKVNGEIITRSELERTRKQMEAELQERAKLKGPELASALKEREKDILRERIDQMLLVQKGKELDLKVDSEVSKYLGEIQKDAVKRDAKLIDADKFAAYVKEQTGMSIEDFKAETKNNILTRRVIGQEVQSKLNVSKADAQKYYNEHKDMFQREERVFLREIFLSTEGKDPAAQAAIDKKAKDLVARVKKGEKFHELARDNSDSDSAKQDGELPPYKKGELMKEIEPLVWGAERNAVLEPIKRPNGWLILKVEEHHKAGLASFEEVENEVMGRMVEPRVAPAVREYLTKLRQDAFLEIREGYVDSGAAPGKDTKWSDPAQLKPETVTKEEVANQKRRKRLLGAVPIPGTSATPKSKSKQ
jgi:peptidyl-prolyl cis-trans isomerase SurA